MIKHEILNSLLGMTFTDMLNNGKHQTQQCKIYEGFIGVSKQFSILKEFASNHTDNAYTKIICISSPNLTENKETAECRLSMKSFSFQIRSLYVFVTSHSQFVPAT